MVYPPNIVAVVCREVAIVERWPSVKVQLYQLLLINFDCLINYIAFTSERQPLE